MGNTGSLENVSLGEEPARTFPTQGWHLAGERTPYVPAGIRAVIRVPSSGALSIIASVIYTTVADHR